MWKQADAQANLDCRHSPGWRINRKLLHQQQPISLRVNLSAGRAPEMVTAKGNARKLWILRVSGGGLRPNTHRLRVKFNNFPLMAE